MPISQVSRSWSAIRIRRRTSHTTLDWTDDSEALTLPAAADTTDWDSIFRTWNFEVPYADMETLDDAATTTERYLSLRARLDRTTRVRPPTPFAAIVFPPTLWVISDITVQVEDATGGTGVGGDEFADGNTAAVVANSQVTLNVVGIDGTFDGAPITGGEVDYAATLTDIASRTQWSAATNDTIAGFQYTDEVLVLSGASGNGVTGDVFPDDDVEAAPEGRLVANLAALSTYIPVGIQIAIDINVTEDAAAPLVDHIVTSAGMDGGNHLVDRQSNTVVDYYFDFGGPTPGDFSTVGATIYDLSKHDGTGEVMAFDYNDPPAAAGDYAIRDDPGGDYILTAILGPGNLSAGKTYALRIEDGVYNSVNKPDEYLTPGPLPPTVIFSTLPDTNSIDPNIDYLWIFWPEPKMRRNSRSIFNLESGTVVPDDEDAFNDIIKTTGNEFWFEDAGGTLFPRTIIVEDTDPSSISVNDASAVVGYGYQNPGFIVMDIDQITLPGEPGDDPRHFGFRVFSQAGPLGGGTFDVQPQAMAAMAAAGIDWGINIFDGAIWNSTIVISATTF